jgi:hypothetical protein
MQKPKSVTYGIRLLYVQVVVVTLLLGWLIQGMSTLDAVFVLVLPIAAIIYFIRLLSKGTFWIRSVLLVGAIFNVIRLLTDITYFFSSVVGWVMILLLFLEIRALFYLYSKESNAWYAHILMEENLKKQKIKF